MLESFYSDSECSSSEILTQWFDSLEFRSSHFWHFCNLNDEDRKEKRANSVESMEATTSESTDGDYGEENSLEGDHCGFLSVEPCRSIAHRETDLLVALSENCSLGPVCYFCR